MPEQARVRSKAGPASTLELANQSQQPHRYPAGSVRQPVRLSRASEGLVWTGRRDGRSSSVDVTVTEPAATTPRRLMQVYSAPITTTTSACPDSRRASRRPAWSAVPAAVIASEFQDVAAVAAVEQAALLDRAGRFREAAATVARPASITVIDFPVGGKARDAPRKLSVTTTDHGVVITDDRADQRARTPVACGPLAP